MFGKPGSVSFSTSPNLKVTFTAEATEVKYNEASFTIGHAGYEALTYTCFVTTDSATSAAQLAQSDFASNVTEGKLNEGVVLLSGNSVQREVEVSLHGNVIGAFLQVIQLQLIVVSILQELVVGHVHLLWYPGRLRVLYAYRSVHR